MTSTTYQSLSEKWKLQENRFKEWRLALVSEAHKLRDELATAMGSPEHWLSHDSRQKRRYVELVDLSTPEKSAPSLIFHGVTNDKGELVFGISLTFDNGANTYPKSSYHLAIVVRYKAGASEFCRWDTDSNEPAVGAVWKPDKDAMVAELIKIIDSYFSFDPFNGIPQRLGIGFISSQ
jgi:hypothetical protein